MGHYLQNSYGYPEYDYIYTDTKYRPAAAPSPSVLDEVTKFVSSGKSKLKKWVHFVNKIIRWKLITNSKTDLLKHFHRASKFCQRVWWCTWFEAKCSRVVFIKCSCDTFSCFSITPFVSCTFDWSARRYEFTLIDYFRAKLVILWVYIQEYNICFIFTNF